MKITFITHSTFLLETDASYILFDYFEGELPTLTPDKPVYVFASHSHGDHFSEKVFGAVAGSKNVSFILSKDIFKSRVPSEYIDKTLFVSPGKEYSLDGMTIKTLRSTDAGVAFLVNWEGKTIYHGGDLNCWVWDNEPSFQNKLMIEAYRNEMKLIKGEEIDCAFVPLDPRLEDMFYLGMRNFMDICSFKKVFPMHMWGDFSVIERYKKLYPQEAERLVGIEYEGQSFEEA